MSLFLGKLQRYYKGQQPTDLLNFGFQFEDPEFPYDNMVYSTDQKKNEKFNEIVRNNLNLGIDDEFEIEFESVNGPYNKIFDEKINCTKFRQNIIGNCYFLDVLSLLSNYGQLLTQIFRIDKMNMQGYYEICLFIDGQWQIVIIDDKIPYLKINGEIHYIGCSPLDDSGCCYFVLLEKAFAKVKGSYVDMDGGFSYEAFHMLTGFSYKLISHESINSKELYNYIYEKMRESGYLFCCESHKELVGEYHAFSILNVEKFKTINMIQLRNPWGAGQKELISDENKISLANIMNTFLKGEQNGIMWVDEANYHNKFICTECCYSMLGSNVITFRFSNIKKDIDHNIFMDKSGKLLFKLVLTKEERIILSHNFSYYKKNEGPNLKFDCYNLDNNQMHSLDIEFTLNKGKYVIIASFDNVDIKRDNIYLIVNLYCLNEVKFGFIKSVRPEKEKNIIYKDVFNNSEESLKRTKSSYRHLEDLRDKYLYHQTLIKFFKEKLGCEFSMTGLGFYLDTFQNDKVECMIRINKGKRAKFKQIVVSQEIKPNKALSNEIYVGTSHIKGEIVGRGEVWKIKEVCTDENLEKNLDAECIFRGEVVKNKKIETKKEIIEDKKVSEFREEINNDQIENIEDKIASLEIFEEDKKEGIIRIRSKLNIKNKFENKIKSPLHDHYLYLCNTERSFLGEGYICNICKKDFKNSIPSFYCTLCDFDMCPNCTKLTEFLPESIKGECCLEGNYWQFKSSTHQHPMTYLTLKNISKPIYCDNENCNNIINSNVYFYYCSGCEYHLCEECKLKEKPGNIYQFSTYWHNHPLSFCIPLNIKSLFRFTCNHCGQELFLKFSFYCTKCNYYLCFNCFLNYTENFKDVFVRTENDKIPIANNNNNNEKMDFQIKIKMHLHPLTFCIIRNFSENDKYFRCHICKEKFKDLDIYYLCSLCDFKYCKKCIDKILTNDEKKENK